MRTVVLPLTPAAAATAIAVESHADGSATLYEAGDTLPAHLIPPPLPPPATLTARQIRLALNQMGLRDAVEAAVAAGPRDLRDWWEYSIELHRDHPMIATMADAIGVTAEQVDALWRLGVGL